MATGVTTWSQTSSSNSAADSSVNWAEGQAPSSVNDSARAMMASVAKWRDDFNGTITTGGSSTAYTVTSNQSFGSLAAGLMVAFVAHTGNGATVTLNVDGLGAKPLRSAPGVELGASVLVQGTPYCATYYTSNSGEWVLHGFYSNPYNIPLGGGIEFWGTSAPSSNFVFPYGQALSRTTYADLFAIFSTTYGSGDGTTTFNIPDKRGRVSAGKDDMGGSSANRLTNFSGGLNGDSLGATGGSEKHQITLAQLPSTNLSIGSISVTNGENVVHTTGTFTESASGNDRASLDRSATNTKSEISLTGNVPLGGSGDSHNNVQPTIVCNYIIRVI